jgi:hypothetical protein
MPVERQGITVQVVKGELARSPRGVSELCPFIKDLPVFVFIVERIRIVNEKPQPRRPHFVLILKLHMDLDSVAAQTDVIGRCRPVTESQCEFQAINVETNRFSISRVPRIGWTCANIAVCMWDSGLNCLRVNRRRRPI